MICTEQECKSSRGKKPKPQILWVAVNWCYMQVKRPGCWQQPGVGIKVLAQQWLVLPVALSVPQVGCLWVALFLMRVTSRREGTKALNRATISLLMVWSLFQLSQASEPQLRPGQDDVYNVSNYWVLFVCFQICYPDRSSWALTDSELPVVQKNLMTQLTKAIYPNVQHSSCKEEK